MKKGFLLLGFLLVFTPLAKSQQDSSNFQVGVKTWSFYPWNFKKPISVFEPFRFSIEGQYLTNGNRWAIGFHYFTFLSEQYKEQTKNAGGPIKGLYLEREDISWHLNDQFSIGVPFRFSVIWDHYLLTNETNRDNPLWGRLSGGVNLRYQLFDHWELGFSLRYLGYNKNLKAIGQEGHWSVGETGLFIYYGF